MRKAIFWLHLVCGVVVGVIILIMSVTGAMLAFEPQIVSWAERDARIVQVPTEAKRLSLNDILTSAQQDKPKAKATAITVYADPTSSVAVMFGREDMVYVNPYTGQVLGGKSGVQRFMDDVEVWHRWLGGKEKLKPLGHNVKAVCNIIFLIIIISGFYLWWPRQWSLNVLKSITLFNPRVTGKARNWNWHNVIGFWTAPVLIIICLTGVIMSYQWANSLFYRLAANETPPVQDQKRNAPRGGDEKPFEIGELEPFLRIAQEKDPTAKSYSVRLPVKPKDKVVITTETSKLWFPHARSTLTIDQETQQVTKWEPFSEQSRGRQGRMVVRYLHTGEALGIIGQIIACIAAAGAVVLVVTGFLMAGSRFQSWRNKRKLKGA